MGSLDLLLATVYDSGHNLISSRSRTTGYEEYPRASALPCAGGLNNYFRRVFLLFFLILLVARGPVSILRVCDLLHEV